MLVGCVPRGLFGGSRRGSTHRLARKQYLLDEDIQFQQDLQECVQRDRTRVTHASVPNTT